MTSCKIESVEIQKIPLLRDIFERGLGAGKRAGVGEKESATTTTTPAATSPVITLATLAQSLNVPVSRLLPLARENYLKLQSSGEPAPNSYVEVPPAAALQWLRQFLQPAQAKPLFTLEDVADLLGLSEQDTKEAAASYDIPVTLDSALGLLFSMWAVRELARVLTAAGVDHAQSQRFDRQALVHFLLGDAVQNQVTVTPPTFEHALEIELERVAALPEPQRSTRAAALWQQWRDARVVAESVLTIIDHSAASSPAQPSAPDSPVSGSAPISNATRVQEIEQKFYDRLSFG